MGITTTTTPMMVKTDTVRTLVRESLNDLSRGELFMKIGLEEHALSKLVKQDTEEFQTFLDYVIEQFMITTNGNKETSKKEKRKLSKFFMSKKETVSLEIKTFINDQKKNTVTNTSSTTSTNVSKTQTETVDNNVEDIEDDMYSAVKKKKKKRKKAVVEQSPPASPPRETEEPG